MKKRPLSIRLISLLFMLSPLGIIAELIFLYDIPLGLWYLVFNPGIWNWQVITLTILTPLIGVALWTVQRWAYYCLLAFSVLILANNLSLWIINRGLSNQAWQRILFILLILGFVLIILRKDFQAPYFNPRLRWWEQAHRYCPGAFKVTFFRFGTVEKLFEATLFDISATGIFVVSDWPLAIGDMFGVDVSLSDGQALHASAEVVRITRTSDSTANATKQSGFGCRFSSVERNFDREIRKALSHMKAELRKR